MSVNQSKYFWRSQMRWIQYLVLTAECTEVVCSVVDVKQNVFVESWLDQIDGLRIGTQLVSMRKDDSSKYITEKFYMYIGHRVMILCHCYHSTCQSWHIHIRMDSHNLKLVKLTFQSNPPYFVCFTINYHLSQFPYPVHSIIYQIWQNFKSSFSWKWQHNWLVYWFVLDHLQFG